MKITVLMENTALSERYLCRHGLSLYIETQRHKILFDMGPDASFLENARILGVDISQADTAFLSHGHYDHGGGLKVFLEENHQAEVHMQEGAFGKYYAHDVCPKRIRYIGLDAGLAQESRLIFHKGSYRLDEELEIFSEVEGAVCASPANDHLFEEKAGKHVRDRFFHEQNLLIHGKEGLILISGCAHNGIVNILEKAERISGQSIKYVVGGFHLSGVFEEDEEKRKEFFERLAGHLKSRGCVYYTCHCTGLMSYETLKEQMGDQIRYLSAGTAVELK